MGSVGGWRGGSEGRWGRWGVGAVGAVGAVSAEGVWAHIGSLKILLKHLQGRPGWWGRWGGWCGGGENGARAAKWGQWQRSRGGSEGGWRRRRVGGQSADGGGDGEGLERGTGQCRRSAENGVGGGVAVSPTFEACYFFLTGRQAKTNPSGFHWRRPSRGRRIIAHPKTVLPRSRLSWRVAVPWTHQYPCHQLRAEGSHVERCQ